MRADPELPAEHPHQVGRVSVDRLRRLLSVTFSRKRASISSRSCHARFWPACTAWPGGVAAGAPRWQRSRSVTKARRLSASSSSPGSLEHAMQLVDALAEERVGQQGLVDG